MRPSCLAICHADQRYYLGGLRQPGKLQREASHGPHPRGVRRGGTPIRPAPSRAGTERSAHSRTFPRRTAPIIIYENYRAGAALPVQRTTTASCANMSICRPTAWSPFRGDIPIQPLAAITEFVSVGQPRRRDRFGQTARTRVRETRRRLGRRQPVRMSSACALIKKLFRRAGDRRRGQGSGASFPTSPLCGATWLRRRASRPDFTLTTPLNAAAAKGAQMQLTISYAISAPRVW